MQNNQTSDLRNLIIALALSACILGYWEYFIEAPRKKVEAQVIKAQSEQQVKEKLAEQDEVKKPKKSRNELLADSPRIPIRSPYLHGSLDLRGLRFDDLTLAKYREELAPTSPEVTLFSPSGHSSSYFAEFGWTSEDSKISLPSAISVWTANQPEIVPNKPVTLSWKNDQGITFNASITLDDHYMFTVKQTVSGKLPENSLRTYSYIHRIYNTKTNPSQGVHEGPLGVFDGRLQEFPYSKMMEEPKKDFEAQAGWIGMSDKYWLSAIIPTQGAFNAQSVHYNSRGSDHFQVIYTSPIQDETTVRFFAGAKELGLLDTYRDTFTIPLFDRAVDFGTFFFLFKPIFLTLDFFFNQFGNFGLAILSLTVVIKLLMYPLANKSFKAMNRMKELQPKMLEIRERCKDDKMKLNKEIMELYKREKVNPAAGCFPLLIQLPVFFALLKVLTVTIEMRHAPFFGWVHDLSARDTSNLFNLFGLIDWTPPTFLHLGFFPLLMCLTMVIQQMQSPPPPDPTQAKIIKAMPFFLLFIFASLPAGLVIYYCWSNSLSILQQWVIKKRHEKEVEHKR